MTTPPSFQPYPVPPPSPQAPRKRPRWLLPVLIGVGVVLLLCVGTADLGAFLPDKPSASPTRKAATATAAEPVTATTPAVPTTEPTTEAHEPTGLTKADVILKVKIKKQECFGSAGCNVEFTIQAAWPSEKVQDGQKYDVTYEVSGIEDGPQVATLTIVSPTEFEQDSFQYAQTSRHVRTLKVKVTDVELQYGG